MTDENTMVHCRACGTQMHSSAKACPKCGAPQKGSAISEKKILPAFLLCSMLGFLGAHRFYAGKVGTGIAQLFTLGGFGIWALIDLIILICGSFTDGDGNKITEWV